MTIADLLLDTVGSLRQSIEFRRHIIRSFPPKEAKAFLLSVAHISNYLEDKALEYTSRSTDVEM
jgi:hypothetical protein